MSHQNQELAVQLLDSTFNKQDALDVLLALFDHKISFHQAKLWSEEERFSVRNQQSEIRVQELKAEKERIKEFLQQMDDNDRISVSGLLHLRNVAEQSAKKLA